MPLQAEVPEVVQDSEAVIQLQGGSICAVVTVLAVKIAYLGDVPLKGKDRGGEKTLVCHLAEREVLRVSVDL